MPSRLRNQIIGHAAILRILEAAIQHPAPAYLFFGQPHLGKRTLAERFVNALLISSLEKKIDRVMHPDLIVLETMEGKKEISIEQVRRARERLSLRPVLAPRMVVYVPQADRLNDSGINALLKSLEEPPADAVFVLIAEDVERFPATLLSRVVKIPCDIVPRAEIVAALMARGVSQDEADLRAARARGRPGLALSSSLQPAFDRVVRIYAAHTTGERLAKIAEWAQSCEAAEDAQSAWRESILDAMQETSALLRIHPIEATLLGIALATALRFVGSPISPQLALEAGVLRLSSHPELELRQMLPKHTPSSLPLLFAHLVY